MSITLVLSVTVTVLVVGLILVGVDAVQGELGGVRAIEALGALLMILAALTLVTYGVIILWSRVLA